jgi:uncharacterized protein YrrD
MTRLVRATALIGLPVVTFGGEDVAEVRDVVYDADRGALMGFTLNKRGFFSGRLKQVLTIDNVSSIGEAAVMVGDEDALIDKGEAPETVAGPPADRDVIGAPVMTDDGAVLGEVTDVIVSLGTDKQAVGYELETPHDAATRAFIPLPEQLAVSGEALMVPRAFTDFIRDDLSGFGAAVDEYRADHHVGRGGSGARGDSRSRGHDSRTKAELYEEARRRKVPGRSSMTKAELAAALTQGHEGA